MRIALWRINYIDENYVVASKWNEIIRFLAKSQDKNNRRLMFPVDYIQSSETDI